jgi:hypothetical protein
MKKGQIYNLLYFTMLFGTTTTSINKCSPDYILEKYDTFISARLTKKIKKSNGFINFLSSYYSKWNKIDLDCFTNILYFLYKTTYEKYVWDTSPGFILENFKKYIGDPEIIKDDINLCNVVHVVIRRKFEETYLTKITNERQIKILNII